MRLIELPAFGGPRLRVGLRALTGADELSLTSAEPEALLALLSRLCSGSGETRLLEELSLAQIDRLFAKLYRDLYSERAECHVRCTGCGQSYEFTLDLGQVQRQQDAEHPGPADASGWLLADGRRLRAPRLADLREAGSAERLLDRLLEEPAPPPHSGADPVNTTAAKTAMSSIARTELAEFLERAAPVLTLDLAAPCPHCARANTVRFDLPRYLGQRVLAERPFLIRESHLLASRYGWSHAEIMALTREDRRTYARLIESERAGALRRRAG